MSQPKINDNLYYKVIPTAPPITTEYANFSFNNSNTISCIYCLGDEENLFINNLCACSYYYHKECFIQYINQPRNFCPLCRNEFLIPNATIFFSTTTTAAIAQPQSPIPSLLNRNLDGQLQEIRLVDENNTYSRFFVRILICVCVLLMISVALYIIFSLTIKT